MSITERRPQLFCGRRFSVRGFVCYIQMMVENIAVL